MIKPNELRIGNYLLSTREYFEKPMVGKVYNISTTVIAFEYEEEGQRIGATSNPMKFLYPIQLREEWLLRAEFDKKDIKWSDGSVSTGVFIKGKYLIEFTSEGIIFCEKTGTTGYRFIRFIEYVHQLQNLYFALTETELEIKETVK